MKNHWISKVAVWLGIVMVLFTVYRQFEGARMASSRQVGYSDFLEQVRNNRVKSVVIQETPNGINIDAVMLDKGDSVRTTQATNLDRGLIGDLINHNVKFDVRPREEPSLLVSILLNWMPMLLWSPMLLLIGLCIYFSSKGRAFNSRSAAYSGFLEQVRNNRVKSVIIQRTPSGANIEAVMIDGEDSVRIQATAVDIGLVGDLISHNVKFDVRPG